jgi:hypothetical protein
LTFSFIISIFYGRYGYIRKKKAEKLAIKHQYELKLSDIARTINEDPNMNIGIYIDNSLNGYR